MYKDTDTVIRASGIKKSFQHVKVLDGIDLNVQKGTLLALLGPNGAGKTTLVQLKQILDHMEQVKIEVKTVALHKPTLDDVFLALTGRQATKEVEEGGSNG